MAEKKSSSSGSGMIYVVSYLTLFVANVVVLYLANMFFPELVVLGTISLTMLWGILLSMGVLTLIDVFAIPFVHVYENKRGKMFNSMEWMVAYFLINLGGIWLIARFPDQFGFGIKSWLVAVVLAVVMDFFQGMVMMQLAKLGSKLS